MATSNISFTYIFVLIYLVLIFEWWFSAFLHSTKIECESLKVRGRLGNLSIVEVQNSCKLDSLFPYVWAGPILTHYWLVAKLRLIPENLLQHVDHRFYITLQHHRP